jgi:N-acetylglucosamine-6-phosphate deacetylase
MHDSVDLQVNGYAGVDFNSDQVGTESFHHACESLRNDGVSSILATVITDSIDTLQKRLSNIVDARNHDALVADVIFGVHIEGPFLNPEPGYIGAHPREYARPAELGLMKRLTDAAAGLTRIVTLAPEFDAELKVTRWLSDQGIVVSAGHCNPTRDQLSAAVDAGLSMFTHLGNGCPLHLHRHDNIVQRALNLADYLHIGFIADGIHVPFVALGNYLQLAGYDRSFIVTDAVSAAGMGPGEYNLSGQRVVVDDNLATWDEDKTHLFGSAMTMPRVRDNLRECLGLNKGLIEKLTRANPLAAVNGV